MTCTCSVGSDHPSKTGQHEQDCPLAKPGATVLVFRNNLGQPVAVPQDVVAQAERPYRAYQAHLGGTSWAEIARTEQYANAEAARYDVQRYLDEGKALVALNTRKHQLQLEVARLDALQSVIWPQAMAGHLPAVQQVSGLIMNRAKLMALSEMVENEGDTDGPRTVIIEADQFTQTLEALS